MGEELPVSKILSLAAESMQEYPIPKTYIPLQKHLWHHTIPHVLLGMGGECSPDFINRVLMVQYGNLPRDV